MFFPNTPESDSLYVCCKGKENIQTLVELTYFYKTWMKIGQIPTVPLMFSGWFSVGRSEVFLLLPVTLGAGLK